MLPAAGLAPDLSFCLIDGRPLFLDLRRDLYFRVDGDAEQAIASILAGNGDADPAPLFDTGIAVPGSHAALLPAAIQRATASLVERQESGAVRYKALPSLAARLAWLQLRLKLGQLASLVQDLRRAGRTGTSSHTDATAESLDFAAMRPWVPIALNCLLDSLCLASILKRRGLDADLVVAVKTDPFAAHAWVQSGDLVLNDMLDNVYDFTPILVV